jgi:crotonobetainyl-CoA:carnitine CoA-transferase CaiB-like acyl-CoA transferase
VSGPLAGVRVLDLTGVVLGPLATQILGDYGADVVKVENLEGDLIRTAGVSLHRGMSANRNKRSLALDLKSADGREVLKRLVARSDVFVHNMRVAAVEKLGFGYAAVSALKPDIVYCAATGFGQDGPDRDKPAFDDVIQAACGLAKLNSGLNGVGHAEPFYTPTLVADKTAGLALVNAVLAALFHRERTGKGQYVEVPMFETLVAFILCEHLGGLSFEPPPAKAGYPRIMAGGRKPVPTKDGWAVILPYTADHWVEFFNAAGRADLIEKYSVKDRQKRNANIVALYGELPAITRLKTTAEWMDVCERLDVPATPIYALDELPDHPHLKAVGMFQRADHPTEGPVRYVRPPTRFQATPADVRRLAPSHGEHSAEILREAGYGEEEIAALAGRRVIVTPRADPSPARGGGA